MKNYLILSDDYITINSYIDKILKDNKMSSDNVIKYSYPVNEINYVIDELNTYGFFTQNKVVIYSDVSFLSSKKDESVDLSSLEQYINNPNDMNILILVTDKIDNKRKINKLINEKFTVYSKEISIEDKIKENLEDYKMNLVTRNYLISVCSNNNERILNELEKLKMYKLEEKEITSSDIDKIVIKNLDDDIFSFINAIVKKDKKKCFELYENLLEKGENIVKMVILISDQFRLIYNCKVLSSDRISSDRIAEMFNMHPFRIKKALEYSYSFSFNELLDYLKQLGDIDRKIKSESGNKNIYFEQFMLNL